MSPFGQPSPRDDPNKYEQNETRTYYIQLLVLLQRKMSSCFNNFTHYLQSYIICKEPPIQNLFKQFINLEFSWDICSVHRRVRVLTECEGRREGGELLMTDIITSGEMFTITPSPPSLHMPWAACRKRGGHWRIYNRGDKHYWRSNMTSNVKHATSLFPVLCRCWSSPL